MTNDHMESQMRQLLDDLSSLLTKHQVTIAGYGDYIGVYDIVTKKCRVVDCNVIDNPMIGSCTPEKLAEKLITVTEYGHDIGVDSDANTFAIAGRIRHNGDGY